MKKNERGEGCWKIMYSFFEELQFGILQGFVGKLSLSIQSCINRSVLGSCKAEGQVGQIFLYNHVLILHYISSALLQRL